MYHLEQISLKDLPLVIKMHLEDYSKESMQQGGEINTLSGGYVLNIDGNDLLFPQCCGSLIDVAEWEGLVDGEISIWIGHPYPQVIQKKNEVVLVCQR